MTQTTTTTAHDIHVGDLFYASWGYDQTNIDFYEVVRVTKAKAELRPIRSDLRGTGRGTQYVAPLPGSYRDGDVLIQTGNCTPYGKPQRDSKLCTIRPGWKGDEWIIRLCDRNSAYRYTTPLAETDPMCGH
jgi:hypothetical protein